MCIRCNWRLAAALAALTLLALSCGVFGEKGAQAPVVAQGNTLAPAPATGDNAAPGGRAHPRVSSLVAPTEAQAGVIDARKPALDDQGLAMTGGTVCLAEGGAELSSSGGLSWVIYCVAGAGEATPDTLRLQFSHRDGAVWVALPDFTKGRWDWSALDSGGSVDLPIDPALRLKGGATYVTLAVHDGANAVFYGGALFNAAVGPPDTGGTGSEPPAKLPSVVGAYLSLGYWDEQAVDDTMAQLAKLKVNLVIDYALIPPEDEYWRPAFQHYLDAAQANKIGIAFYVEPALYGMAPDAPGEHMPSLVAQIDELKSQPAITAWYVHDEVLPDVQNDWGSGRYAMTLAQMQQLYLQIHAADPSRPQLNVWCYLPGFTQFQSQYIQYAAWGQTAWMKDEAGYEQAMADMVQTTCDWVLVDDYPVGAPWGAGDAAAEAGALVQRAAELKAQEQPLVFVFQSFSWAQYDPENAADAAFPTRDEMEAMLCAAHLNGATGAVAYSWFDLTGSEPSQQVPGRDAALDDTMQVLTALGKSGWPQAQVPLGASAVRKAPAKAAAAYRQLKRHIPQSPHTPR
jgi:hypothetical protein